MTAKIEKIEQVLMFKMTNKRLDLKESTTLNNQIEQYLSIPPTCILIDFEQVKFIDSGGLGWLISLNKQLRPFTTMILFNVINRTINDIFQLTRMDAVFNIATSLDEAKKMVYSQTNF